MNSSRDVLTILSGYLHQGTEKHPKILILLAVIGTGHSLNAIQECQSSHREARLAVSKAT